MAPQEQRQQLGQAPAERDKAEGDRDTVSPEVERASRVKESQEADNQHLRRPAPQPHESPTPDQAE